MFNLSDPATVGRILADPDFLQKFLTVLPDPVVIYDVKRSRIIYFNDRLTEVLGYQAADIEAMGGNLLSVILEQEFSRGAIEAGLNLQHLEENFVFDVDYLMRHKNGELRNLHAKMTILKRDEKGEPIEFLAIFADVTEHQHVRQQLIGKVEELNRLNIQLESQQGWLEEAEVLTGFGSFEWEVSGNRLFWSEGMFHLFGYPNEAGRPAAVDYEFWFNHIHPDDRDHVARTITRHLDAKEPFADLEHRIIDRQGQLRYLVCQGKMAVNEAGETTRILGSSVDVTQKHRYQRELEELVEALRRSNHHLEEFAYVASHDLREPLRKIISFGDRLNARYQSTLGEEGEMYLERMQEAARRMERLIDDLLHFSRVTRRTDAFSPVNPRESLQSVLKDLEVTIDRCQATVYIADGPWSEIEAIESQLQQYIQNIISNSLKFARPGTPPVIEVSCEKVQSEDTGRPDLKPGKAYFKLEIRDNGIGFEPEYAERIFTLFQRLNGRGDYEGNGIGLAICKKIAENHHGVVYANSRPGEGATFTLLLPASQN